MFPSVPSMMVVWLIDVQLPAVLFCSAVARSGSPYWADPPRAEPMESFLKAELTATDPGTAGGVFLNVPYSLLLSGSPGLFSAGQKVLRSLQGGGG